MAGYTRNDTSNNIANGNVIDADDFDGEFNAIESAFNGSTGHVHDGTSGNGPLINTSGICDNAITEAKVCNAAVTTAKLGACAVETAKIADSAVTTTKIADLNLTTAKLADNAVTTAKINDDAVTVDKLGACSVTATSICDGALATINYGDTTISGAKLCLAAVDTAQIADNAITTAKIASGTIATSDIADNAITSAKLANPVTSATFTALTATCLCVSTDMTIDGYHPTGTCNLAIGENSYSTATAGSFNVALGADSMGSGDVTGLNNTGVGNNALQGLTTGCYNTALGSNAGLVTQTSIYNTYIGFNAGYSSTTNSNTYVGAISFQCAVNGANTGLGSGSGGSTTTGLCNTFVGVNSGWSNTTGTNNIAIGMDVGRTSCSPLALGTIDNTVLIGNNNHTCFVVTCAWSTSSDCRDKTDVTDTTYGIDFVKALRPVEYKWDRRSRYVSGVPDGTHKDIHCSIGFLAQDVNSIQSDYGTVKFADGTDESLLITKEDLIAPLVKAIQQLEERLAQAETTIEELTND